MTDTYYADVDFRPAPPGWRVVCLGENPPRFFMHPLAGWLIQEERIVDPYGERDQAPDCPERRVVPAEVQEGNLEWAIGHWTILGPGEEPGCTPEEAVEYRRRDREQTRKRKAAA